MIFITRIQNALELTGRTHTQREHAEGLRVRDIVHEPWPEGRVVKVNGVKAGPEELLLDGDRLLTYDEPRVEYLIAFTITTLLSLAVSTFAPKPKKRGEASSPSHSWTGIASARGEGNPVPKSFGRDRSGGQVIGEYTQNKGKSGSFVRRLIGFGVGRYGSIAGVSADTQQDQPLRAMHGEIPSDIWMGDKRLDVFRSADVHIRLGTAAQLPIEGWDRTTQTIEVGQDMKRPDANGTSSVEQYISASPSPTDDPAVAEFGIEVDLSESDIDAFTVQVRFPNGCYSLGSLGEVLPWFAGLYVEMQEKDPNGNLVTTGGPHSDGILRFRPTPLLVASQQGDFGFDWEFPCYDPQLYTQPPLGKLGSFNFENAFAEAWMQKTSPTVPAAWNDGDPMDAFSLGAWIVLRPNGAFTGATSSVDDTKNVTDNPVFAWHDAGTERGFQLVLGTRTFNIGPGGGGQVRTRIVPIAFLGDGTETKQFYERNTSGAHASTTADDPSGDVDFRHVVHGANDAPVIDYARVWVTYKADAVNGLDRLRIYAQGELVLEVLDNIELLCTSASFLLGRDAASDATNKRYFKGHLDEVVLENRELTETEAERDYATGRGKAWTSTSTTVALYRFDTSPAVQGDTTTTADSSSNSNTLTLKLVPNTTPSNIRAGSLASIIETDVGNVVRKGRYVARIVGSLRDVTNGNRVDDMRLEAVQRHISETFNFAGEPLLAIKVRADEEGAGTPQDTTAVHEGIVCRIYSGTDTPTPSFVERTTRNPAWIALYEVQSRLSGLGQFVTVDAQTLRDAAAWAAYCDELVYDLRGLTALDDLDTDVPVYDMRFDSTLDGGSGGIEIFFRSSPTLHRPPAHWKVGSKLAFRGMPTGNYDFNIDDGFLGFEIIDVQFTGGVWVVTIAFDAATYGDPWTDGVFFATFAGPGVTGTIEGREERLCFDDTFDEQRQAWDDLFRICAVGHARPTLDGLAVRFTFDGPVDDADVFDLVGMGNIVKDSFAWKATSETQEPNAYDATFRDETRNYDNTVVSGEDPDIQGTTTLDRIRREPIELFGVSRRSQAQREIFQRILKNKLVTERGSVKVGPDSVAWVPGIVNQLSHDLLPPSGKSGRILQVDTDSSIKLDRVIVLAAATTYSLAIRNSYRLNGETFEVRTVTSAAGTYAIGSALTVSAAFSFTPNKGDVYSLYVQGTERRVRVGDMNLGENLQRQVALELYVPAVHDLSNVPDIPLANS